ncbi:gliding motility-associated C-terminal domain-containing protein, partial [Crocinitomicaceae bacterium]|nr:gliding motility-associated C-terminal domain-containing protein [Crocinitomicaceae bacterium]
KLMIFNRWGELIFETDDYKIQWAGYINNSDTQAQEGVYTYKSIIHDVTGKEHLFLGHITLIR